MNKAFLPALGWGILIFILSALPKSSIEKFNWSDILSLDKAGHVIMYGIMAFLLCRGMIANKIKNPLVYSIGIASIYGALLEVLQYSCFQGRYFEILDLIANIIGSIIGAVIFYYLIKKN